MRKGNEMYIRYLFQHTAARRRLENITEWIDSCRSFNTQPPEGGWAAAARHPIQAASFNTQPPEGGWLDWLRDWLARMLFQHTAARRRLGAEPKNAERAKNVSTHSRPKAAGTYYPSRQTEQAVSTHSRPKAAGGRAYPRTGGGFGFNTQPPEGGWQNSLSGSSLFQGFNTQPPEGGWSAAYSAAVCWLSFQHTAARRRLVQGGQY